MKLVLCAKPYNLGSWLLRAIMWSKYSHAAILDEATGTVTDTTLWGGGVKQHDCDTFFDHYPVNELREITIYNEGAARDWLAAQVGKGYDWTALLSWIVRRNWQEDDRWFCSELAEAMIDKFGRPRFRASASRISPRHQEMVV